MPDAAAPERSIVPPVFWMVAFPPLASASSSPPLTAVEANTARTPWAESRASSESRFSIGTVPEVVIVPLLTTDNSPSASPSVSAATAAVTAAAPSSDVVTVPVFVTVSATFEFEAPPSCDEL